MREIKFRAWNGEKMIYSGFKLHWDGQLEPAYHNEGLGVDSPIMQFTGLTDRNGVEIYEGDVIEFDQLRWLIKFIHGSFRAVNITNEEQKGNWYTPDALSLGSMNDHLLGVHVIGNSHQNPDLLEIDND